VRADGRDDAFEQLVAGGVTLAVVEGLQSDDVDVRATTKELLVRYEGARRRLYNTAR